MQFETRVFHELSLEELYNILQLRSEVFVVEQDCVYQDLDGKDHKAFHVLGLEDKELIAYTRIFPPGKYFDQASIGRVIVKMNHRMKDYGHQILERSIQLIEEKFKTNKIKLSAQVYLIKFYEQHGFRQVGETYLEDGIPHIAMIRD